MSMIPISDIADWPGPEHARWGLGTHMFEVPTEHTQRILDYYKSNQPRTNSSKAAVVPIHQLTHPLYEYNLKNWEKWRVVYEGGDLFIESYVKKFSKRESRHDFNKRKEVTPIAAFASSAIDEIKNSIFQRIGDTTRTGGPDTYQKSIDGELGGVNLQGANMNWFVGHFILPELLVQSKVGVLVDAPNFGQTQADKAQKHPYFIPYRAEDIRTWAYAGASSPNEFAAVLLREYTYILDATTGLPIREVPRFRHMFIDPQTGRVNIIFYDQYGVYNEGPIQLEIKRIPLVVFEITTSLMKNVANHQIALTNMESADIAYVLTSNFPLYVEQYDPIQNNPYLKGSSAAYNQYAAGAGNTVEQITGGAVPGAPVSPEGSDQMDAGNSVGRKYPKGMEKPDFISPPTGPIKISIEKAKMLQDNVRTLVHLALASVQSAGSSAESKIVDRQQGLESGLSAIGLELEHGERRLAEYWSMYEGSKPATVVYPKRWSLKSVADLDAELQTLQKLRDSVPSKTFKSEVNKLIADSILGTKVSPETLDKIKKEIEASKGGSSDPKTIAGDVEIGILSAGTASVLRAYPEDEAAKAQAERAIRLAAMASAQATGPSLTAAAAKEATAEDEALLPANPAARGIADAAVDPKAEAQLEKVGKTGRGEAK